MNDSTRVIRPPRRLSPPIARTAAAVAAAAAIAACGSSSSSSSGSGITNPTAAQSQQDILKFARCMRSHGVSSFPDDLRYQHIPGINPTSPGFKTAQTTCQHLLPVKRPPSGPSSPQTHARLLRLSNCLRAHGYANMPDPKPNPPPSHSSQYNTLYGEGGYWIGIPKSIDAHAPAFIRVARACHAAGVG